MAIKKQFLKSKPVCKVTFTVPNKTANEIQVVGDFNNWDTKATTLKKLKNGAFKGTIDLKTGENYEFRYLVDNTWTNDVEADNYAWNDYAGAENSVLEL